VLPGELFPKKYAGRPLQNATWNLIQLEMDEYFCNYAKVMESKAFDFSTTYLTSTAFACCDGMGDHNEEM
jgi:hypothetical protein